MSRPRRPVLCLLVAATGFALWLPWGVSAQDGAPPLPGEQLDAQEEVLSSPTTYRAEDQGLAVLSVQSRPEGAQVFVDGEARGTTPVTIRDLDEGSHEVILYLVDHGAFRQTVEGRGGRIFVDLESEKSLGVGFVSVRTDPPDARIEVDGQRVGLSPLEVPLEAGSHAVRVSKPGFKDAETRVEVGPEESHAVHLRLEPREGALLVISSPVGAEVLVDGDGVGGAWEPLRVEDVAPGTHSVRVQKEGFRPWVKDDVQVRSAETTTVLAALQPERDYTWVRLYTAPPGARVWLDGRDLGVAGDEGLGFKASKGAHKLYLEVDPAVHPGFEPLEITVSLTEDEVDYSAEPLRLPAVDENYIHAVQLVEREQLEAALGFLDRVDPEHPSYGEARLLVVEVLQGLGRSGEIPLELEALLAKPQYHNNPTLNTALGYWALVAARGVPDGEAAGMLGRAVEALDRAVQSVDLFPPAHRDQLILQAHYYTGMASEILFNLTGEKRYVKKGAQAWEVFFARLELTPSVLDKGWVEKARNHRRSMEFLAKKLGG
ncbi:MAG TPA: PEGA domain-containing protein [Deferrisomatales bacterium]|nr:PEGA domain-containing protein [Deferrisomatales bacterium]